MESQPHLSTHYLYIYIYIQIYIYIYIYCVYIYIINTVLIIWLVNYIKAVLQSQHRWHPNTLQAAASMILLRGFVAMASWQRSLQLFEDMRRDGHGDLLALNAVPGMCTGTGSSVGTGVMDWFGAISTIQVEIGISTVSHWRIIVIILCVYPHIRGPSPNRKSWKVIMGA